MIATCSSASSTPSRRKRKRLRSLTPSEAGLNSDSDSLRSPLAKRKRLAAERTGTSKLKEAISAEDLVEEEEAEVEAKTRSATPASAAADRNEDEDEEMSDDSSSDSSDGEDDEDDFLARELGEDWG